MTPPAAAAPVPDRSAPLDARGFVWTPPAPGDLPRVGPLQPSLPNNHLQYAITWYGLALVTVISGILFVRTRRRELSA